MTMFCLSNQQLQVAIIEAGKIVMTATEKTTSGEARQHAADFLKDAFNLQIERAKMIIAQDEEII